MFLVSVPSPSSRLSARVFDRMFDDTFERFFGAVAQPSDAARKPALDVVETDEAYTVTLDVPGVSKDDVKVAIDGKRVDVSAESKKAADTKEGERLVHRERSSVSWSRSFALPLEIDQAASSAKLDHGVLTLVLAKKRAPVAAQLTIN
jgi:HSP20 family protein